MALQQCWGKPIKFNPKDNPHHVAMYKMAARDRHGAWFARRSVHEGIGFSKFRRAMQQEFPESLRVEGGAGAGAVRGIAADRRLERIDVEGLGVLEVYQVSAAFPGPVTPRDFITMFITTETGLTEKCVGGLQRGKKHIPRHFMIVSRPVEHPDAPERPGYVRGTYESVEIIREIPLHQAQPVTQSTPNLLSLAPEDQHQGRSRGATVGFAESRGLEAKGEQRDLHHASASDRDMASPGLDPELNPVEWTMITRSDPGGGLPRFLVERGTPDAMMGDVDKFLRWACRYEEVPHPAEENSAQDVALKESTGQQQQGDNTIKETEANWNQSPMAKDGSNEKPETHSITQHSGDIGMISNITHALEAGIAAYAPTTVSEHVHNYLHRREQPINSEDQGVSSPETSSINSFMSAEEIRRLSTAPEQPVGPDAGQSTDMLSVASATSSHDAGMAEIVQSGITNDNKTLNTHDKEVLKLAQQREKLDRKLAKKRREEEERLKKHEEKEQSEKDKARQKLEQEMRKVEEKHRKEVEKLEARKAKEAKKAEERRAKRDHQARLSMVIRERDDFRSQLDTFKRENQLLLKRVEELQRENTAMASRLGKLGGADALKGLQEEIQEGRKRAVSMRSEGSTSKKSLESSKDSMEK